MQNSKDISSERDLLYAAGGLAMLFAGAAFLLANPDIRKYVADGIRAAFPAVKDEDLDAGLTALLPNMEKYIGMGLNTLIPDVEKYMKLRSM